MRLLNSSTQPGAITAKQKEYIAGATKLIGKTPGDYTHSPNLVFLKIIWIGIVCENCPQICAGDLAKYAGFRSRSTVLDYQDRWQALPWRDRHGWLMLMERVVNEDNWCVNLYHIAILKMRLDELEAFFRAVDKRHKPYAESATGGFI